MCQNDSIFGYRLLIFFSKFDFSRLNLRRNQSLNQKQLERQQQEMLTIVVLLKIIAKQNIEADKKSKICFFKKKKKVNVRWVLVLEAALAFLAELFWQNSSLHGFVLASPT